VENLEEALAEGEAEVQADSSLNFPFSQENILINLYLIRFVYIF
jgi:hypothetical protein